VKRNLGGGNIKKKLANQGRNNNRDRDVSSRSSGSSRSGSSRSRSSDDDESSSCGVSSDEDDPRDYKKGGYHPVCPYQLYNARYRVLTKLGAGAFSTVWPCADEKDCLEVTDGIDRVPELFAMKVCKSKKSVTEQAEDEVALFERLQEGDNCSPHSVQMQGHFWHSGPNGRHKCMVFEVMGENLLALVKHFDYNGLPVPMVRRLTRHTLLGLEYIHSRGVIHTDVKLENVLIGRHDIADLLSEASRAHRAFTEQKNGAEAMSKGQKKRLKKKQKDAAPAKVEPEAKGEMEGLSKSQKKRLKAKAKEKTDPKADGADGAGDSDNEEPAKAVAGAAANDGEGDESDEDVDKLAAEACGRPVPPVRQEERFQTLQTSQVFAKLADFGNGCRADRKVTDEIQTRQYRSPEVIIGAPWDETADIWSAACMFFELITGDFLFDPSTGENWSRNEDHLALIVELLGDYPAKEYCLSGKYSKDFFSNAGKLKHIKSLQFWHMAGVLSKKYKLSDEDAEELSDFLCPMLTFNPKDRCSATQALKHFWVQPMPGEIDIPTTAALASSQGCTGADAAVEVVRSKGKGADPAKAKADKDAEADEGERNTATASEVSAATVVTEAPTELVSLSSPRETPEEAIAAVVAAVVATPEVVACPKTEEPESKAEPEVIIVEPAPSQDANDDDAKVQLDEAALEADTTQDVEVAAADVPAIDDLAAAIEAATDGGAGQHRGQDCAAASLDEYVDFSSLDLSDSTALVGAIQQPSDVCDLARSVTEAGSEFKRLDANHILVLLKSVGASSAVSAAELARKVVGVSQWMSIEDYKAIVPPDEKPKKKNNKKKGKK